MTPALLAAAAAFIAANAATARYIEARRLYWTRKAAQAAQRLAELDP